MNRIESATSALLISLFIASSARAADTRLPSDGEFRVELNFSNPGARSLGMGGAFVGLADDATAAYANPAGLTNLSRPEVSAEGRNWRYTHVYPDHGHAFGPTTGDGVDNVAGIATANSSDTVKGLSFLSFVYPYERWSFAAYRHELANFQANIATQGLFFDALGGDPLNPTISRLRLLPARLRYDLTIVNYGASAAFRLSDRFSAGVGITYYDMSLDSTTTRYNLKGNLGDQPGGFFGPPLFTDANATNTITDNGEGKKTGANFGLLWKVTNDWSLGAVYRLGNSFKHTVTLNPVGQLSSILPSEEFRIPDVLAIGTAIKPKDQLTVTIDLNHIKYEQSSKSTDLVRTDNVDEVHFGAEYVFLQPQQPKHPISLRLGAWLDPDHQASFQGVSDGSVDQNRAAAAFLRGKDAWHYSGGVGYVFGERFQLDAAYDYSDRINTFSLSSVFRF